MSHEGETFVTAVGCMDGRVQNPVARFARERWDAQYVDTITEAGLVKHFSHEHKHPHSEHVIESVKAKVLDVSVRKHNSKGIVVHGHEECAGNSVDNEQHKREIRAAADVIKDLEPGVEVVPVFVERAEPEWLVRELE